LLAACQTNPSPVAPAEASVNPADEYQMVSSFHLTSSGDVIQPIWLERNVEAGYVEIANDTEYLYLKYNIHDLWKMTSTSVFVGRSLEEMPMDANGFPQSDRFPFAISLDRGMNVYYQQIPLSEIRAGIGDEIVILTKVNVVGADPQNQFSGATSAWGSSKPFGGGEWWTFHNYLVRLNTSGIENVGRVQMPLPVKPHQDN
jgi:hypothetical protein